MRKIMKRKKGGRGFEEELFATSLLHAVESREIIFFASRSLALRFQLATHRI